MTEAYFRKLKTTEAKYEALEKDYVELDLECRIQNKGCKVNEDWLSIFVTGLALGMLTAIAVKD